jgi:hypothetical protein
LEQIFGVLLSLFNGQADSSEWIVACLESAWPKLVGEKLAYVCRPVSFNGKELIIEIADRGWKDAIANLQPALLKKLQTATDGRISAISVV